MWKLKALNDTEPTPESFIAVSLARQTLLNERSEYYLLLIGERLSM